MKFKIKIFAISLILLFCFMGAASAADVSADALNATADDAVAVDTVSEEVSDSAIADETPVEAVDDVIAEPTVPDDATTEEINEETQTDEISEESADVDSEPTRGTRYAANWTALKEYGQGTVSHTIYLTSPITVDNSVLKFGNSATIIGTPNNYITGGNSNTIPFQSTGSKNIKFINVTFKDMSASVLIKFATTGTNQFINCTFDNIHTYAYKSSVIWNDKGIMNITGCNFTNCNDGFGAITNYATSGTVQMNVVNSRFEDNSGRLEPGAINNCGLLNVTNSTFIHNTAGWWAGAIHTHTFAYTRIVGSTFTDNVAGWNGGALFTYSKLEVFNSTFTGNNCTTNTGGGAICGYSYQGSVYNITVDSCNFTKNTNKNSNGRGGAIGVQNMGYLTVLNSTFINNSATTGPAISAICEDVPYCTNCTNCSCPNCPNCTNCTHAISTGDPYCNITNNTFINHTGNGDTVVITGTNYEFNYNIFINSTQTTHYNGVGNQYGLSKGISNVPKNILTSNQESSILGDSTNIFYVNASKTTPDGDGSSWANAYPHDPDELDIQGLNIALNKMYENNVENGIVYIDGEFVYGLNTHIAPTKNCTIIGFDRESTIISNIWYAGYPDTTASIPSSITFINVTFAYPGSMDNNVTFINCTFNGFTTNTEEGDYINQMHYENSLTGGTTLENSFVTTFTNCEFINSVIEDNSLLSIAKYTQINFNNCNFSNIVAKSIVSNIGGFDLQDSINFYECNFANVNVKGIVDIPTGNEISELVHIEGCTYDFSVNPDVLTEGSRDYINITESRTDSNLTIDIDGHNLIITLTDSEGNPIADVDEISVVINDENIPSQMDNGVTTINISDFTGKVNIVASFAGNTNFKESTATLNTYIVVKTVTEVINNTIVEYVNKTLESTSIDANALTATAKVAKTLSVTLKDASGKAIANKVITYSINGVTKTVKTDANGIAKITVNQAKAGAYYYSLCFLGDDDYKSAFKSVKVTVNKQATKAVFKAKTFKVKAKTKKVSFTLKDASGKAIKGKKITVKVNGKTYTAKTNAKGVATVSLKISKKGKYTATAKFAGDTTYKAITKNAKITLK